MTPARFKFRDCVWDLEHAFAVPMTTTVRCTHLVRWRGLSQSVLEHADDAGPGETLRKSRIGGAWSL